MENNLRDVAITLTSALQHMAENGNAARAFDWDYLSRLADSAFKQLDKTENSPPPNVRFIKMDLACPVETCPAKFKDEGRLVKHYLQEHYWPNISQHNPYSCGFSV